MMQNNEFQLTIPSNISMTVFPDNKAQLFKIRLPAPIDIFGDWEVAIMDIQYPRSWFNVQESHVIHIAEISKSRRANVLDTPCSLPLSELKTSSPDLHSLFNLTEEDVHESKIQEYSLIIEPGYYPSPASLMCRLENQLRELYINNSDLRRERILPVQIIYDEIEDRCKFQGPENWAWSLPKESALFRELGIEKENFIENIDYEWNKFPMKGNMTKLSTWSRIYVYTDIIKPQLVGDALLPLIGVAPIKGDHGISAHWNFIPPYYLPVSRTYINDIEFQIKTDQGDFVPFRSGIVVIRLNFKRRLQ